MTDPSEREVFEAWGRSMIRHGGGDGAACEDALCRSSLLDGEYLNSKTEARWQAWQARAALPGPVVVGGRTTEILGPYRHGWLEGREDALRCIAAYDHDSADADARIWDGDAPGPVEIALDTLHDEVSGIKIPMGEDPALPLPSVEDVARVIADAALYGHGRGNIEEARTSARAVLALFPAAPQAEREFFEAAKESERLLRKHPHGMDRHEADLTRAATYDAMQEAADATP